MAQTNAIALLLQFQCRPTSCYLKQIEVARVLARLGFLIFYDNWVLANETTVSG